MANGLLATVFVLAPICIFFFVYCSATSEPASPTFTVKLNNLAENEPVTVTPKRRLKILISNPFLGWSHSQFMGALADTLVDAGHEVHMLTYVINMAFGEYTGSTKAHAEIRHERDIEKHGDMQKMDFSKTKFDEPKNPIWSGDWTEFEKLQANICREILANKPLLEYLKKQNYDFGTAEPYSWCMFGVFKMVGVPTTAISQAIGMNWLIKSSFGIPIFSSFTRDIFTSQTNDPMRMTFYQRAINFFDDIYGHLKSNILSQQERLVQPLFDEAFGEAAPSLRAVMKNVSLAFINTKDFFDLPRPLSKKIVYVGGIAAKDEKTKKPLPENFKSIIESAPKGAVLFSFGTFADTRDMPEELKVAFIRAFANFPDYAFIWKFNARENEKLKVPSNVHIFEWVPQNPILEHPLLKAFISHCGINSANEAAKVGVPVLGVPLFGDQAYNAALIANKGFGIPVNIGDVRRHGSVVVEETLQKLLNDSSYAEKGRILARKLALTPFSPRERFVKWVEFAAEFPDLNELNMPTADEMSAFVYYSLDVIAAIVLFLAVLVFIFVRALLWMRSLARRRFYSPKISNGVANRKKVN